MNRVDKPKTILFKYISLICVIFAIFLNVSCSDESLDSGVVDDGLIIPSNIDIMCSSNVARVELVDTTKQKDGTVYNFNIIKVLNIRSEKWIISEGDTVSFIFDKSEISWLNEHGYVYETGKEYILSYVGDQLDYNCYIPLDNIDKSGEYFKNDMQMCGISSDLPKDEFVIVLEEAIQKMRAYLQNPESEWPFPENN